MYFDLEIYSVWFVPYFKIDPFGSQKKFYSRAGGQLFLPVRSRSVYLLQIDTSTLTSRALHCTRLDVPWDGRAHRLCQQLVVRSSVIGLSVNSKSSRKTICNLILWFFSTKERKIDVWKLYTTPFLQNFRTL